jgi:hypothetical protein
MSLLVYLAFALNFMASDALICCATEHRYNLTRSLAWSLGWPLSCVLVVCAAVKFCNGKGLPK